MEEKQALFLRGTFQNSVTDCDFAAAAQRKRKCQGPRHAGTENHSDMALYKV